MAIKVGCISCEEQRCEVHGVVYHCIVISLLDKTFSLDRMQYSQKMPEKEELGMFGYGMRFKTETERLKYVDYLKQNGFILAD